MRLCGRCNTAGRHDVLRPGVCSACGKATCFVCRGASDDQRALPSPPAKIEGVEVERIVEAVGGEAEEAGQ